MEGKGKKLTVKEKVLIKDAFLAGFMSAGEGWNGEHPFNDGHFESAAEKDRKNLLKSVDYYIKKRYGIPTNKKSAKNI